MSAKSLILQYIIYYKINGGTHDKEMVDFYRKRTVVVLERLSREFWLFFALVTLTARSSADTSRVYRARSLDRGVGAPCRLRLYLVDSLLVDVRRVGCLRFVRPPSIVDFALVVCWYTAVRRMSASIDFRLVPISCVTHTVNGTLANLNRPIV